jgi:murein DD-endopeptidase MepM/ murein hydrolase activator NlpD
MRSRIALACLLGLLLVATTAQAKRVYSYRDEHGILHFTDQAPVTDQPVQARLLRAEPKQWVEALEEGSAEDKRYLVVNHLAGPIEVALSFSQRQNILSTPELPTRLVVPALTTQPMLRVIPEDPTRSSGFNFQFRWMLGDPNARHDDSLRYRLPFRSGEQHVVSQGFGGQFSHGAEHAYFAIDIAMDEGTPVLAARNGVVMLVEKDFFGAGTDMAQWGDRSNHVRIVHPDGTMAIYAHLALETIRLKVGDRVRAGEQIGRSGNTGFSTGPHLHFAVQRNEGMNLISVPFRFAEHPELDLILDGVVLGHRGSGTGVKGNPDQAGAATNSGTNAASPASGQQ